MTIPMLFEQLKDFRKELHIPVILMGYLNPLLQYGFEAFCKKASELGIDGLIIPDIPIHEYEKEYGPIMKQYRLDFIFLITPETTKERIKKLDSLSEGFLYAVSSSSITGSNKDFKPVEAYLQGLQNLHLKNPVLVGFGIKDKQTFQLASRHTNGAIIGSAYINILESAGNIDVATKDFIKGIIE
jgi:tryptophan synthase alpha chain